MTDEQDKQINEILALHLNEKDRRLLAGTIATVYGRGGQAKVASLWNMSPVTVRLDPSVS